MKERDLKRKQAKCKHKEVSHGARGIYFCKDCRKPLSYEEVYNPNKH